MIHICKLCLKTWICKIDGPCGVEDDVYNCFACQSLTEDL